MFDKSITKFNSEDAILIRGLGELNLADTLECGQCFRYERLKDGDGYLFVSGDALIRVYQKKPGELIFCGIDDDTFERVARPLFSLDRELDSIKNEVKERTDSEWLRRAADSAGGIAILSQAPFEALISFIISQNNNIPRIRKIIKQICAEYGVNLCLQGMKSPKCPLGLVKGTPCEENCRLCGVCYSFPTAEDILSRPEGLLPSRPGFRYKYILDACEKVHSGEVNLLAIANRGEYAYTLDELKKIKGVGDKVASCVALFGFGNLDSFPIDVWMKRAIDTYFDGRLDPASLGRYAGVAQQYIFHYIRNIEAR